MREKLNEKEYLEHLHMILTRISKDLCVEDQKSAFRAMYNLGLIIENLSCHIKSFEDEEEDIEEEGEEYEDEEDE